MFRRVEPLPPVENVSRKDVSSSCTHWPAASWALFQHLWPELDRLPRCIDAVHVAERRLRAGSGPLAGAEHLGHAQQVLPAS